MILTRDEIKRSLIEERIGIDPFSIQDLCVNSYSFHLGAEIIEFDAANEARAKDGVSQIIPDEGKVLLPNKLYLGLTVERTQSDEFAQLLFGDRSIGSLGVWVHISAPLAHTGSSIRWTLEIKVAQPVRVYAGMKFGKIFFVQTCGQRSNYRLADLGVPAYGEDKLSPCLSYPQIFGVNGNTTKESCNEL